MFSKPTWSWKHLPWPRGVSCLRFISSFKFYFLIFALWWPSTTSSGMIWLATNRPCSFWRSRTRHSSLTCSLCLKSWKKREWMMPRNYPSIITGERLWIRRHSVLFLLKCEGGRAAGTREKKRRELYKRRTKEGAGNEKGRRTSDNKNETKTGIKEYGILTIVCALNWIQS